MQAVRIILFRFPRLGLGRTLAVGVEGNNDLYQLWNGGAVVGRFEVCSYLENEAWVSRKAGFTEQ